MISLSRLKEMVEEEMENKIKDLELALKRKEQECEELKKIINEAKNSKLDLKSFLVGEAVQNEYEQQLDQLKAELEQEKALKETYLACYKAKHDDIEGKLFKLKATLTEIKEIAETAAKCLYTTRSDDYTDGYRWLGSIILQKISEVEDANV